jgi:hypothetical protein
MANRESAEALTLAMLEQRIAEMDPWSGPARRDECWFCHVSRYRPLRDGGGRNEHKPTCVWLQCTYSKYREALASAPDWRSYAPKDHESRVKGMWWAKPADWELFERGKGRASVWLNGTWHTWDKDGVGGENAREESVEAAKAAAEDAIVRQGWGRPERGH